MCETAARKGAEKSEKTDGYKVSTAEKESASRMERESQHVRDR